MTLPELLVLAGIRSTAEVAPIPVTGIAYDSRRVQPGNVFVAVPGTVTDGHEYLDAAIVAGAVALVVQRSVAGVAVPCLTVSSTRVALADLSAAFYGFPSSRLHVTGITGTDGKTTSVFLLSHVLESLGHQTGLVSTVAVKVGSNWQDNLARQSTPESLEIQSSFAAMVAAGVEDAVVETTSHGLVLDRVRNCAFDAALITNVTSEHLDFHGTRENYLAAKGLLLDALLDRREKPGMPFAAINADDPGSNSLIPRARTPVITFGLQPGVTVRGVGIRTEPSGSHFEVEVDGNLISATVAMPGLFNVYNALGVLAVVHGRGLDLRQAALALANFPGVPGRMRRIEEGQPFSVIVDYAHTADSLRKVLLTLRPLTSGKLIAVFGSAGDRDREKRPVMGAVAAQHADFSIFTDEDPRREPSMQILDAIARGAVEAGAREGRDFLRIPDRREAISVAITRAAAGDVVVLAGKGHERSILVGGTALPWDEEAAARATLRERLNAGGWS